MPSYNLRILLETIEGEKTSYITKGGTVASFVNTATDGFAISSSIAYGRITGSVSCSFQNQTKFTGDTDATKTFKQNTILSASLSGSTATGSIVFTALDSDYDRLLRYKFIGEKVTNVLGLPSDQWIYTDQVRLAADDEANIFQGNANLGNVNISDTLTFAGGSDINSDVPILIDTGSDRYIKFVDERAASIVALRMGYNEDTDVYEISGSDDFSFNIGGVNSFTSSEVNALHLTSSNFILRKNVDGGNATIIIENSNTDNGTDKGAGIEFKHQDLSAGSIIAGKDAAYNTSLGTDTYDSNLKFATTNNGVGSERMRITSLGNVGIGNQSPTEKLVVNGNISASGNIIANQYIVSSSVTNLITQTKSGSTEFGDSADDTHKFTGNITASGNISGSSTSTINVGGNITSLATITAEQITSTDDMSVSGDLSIARYMKHLGNTNTLIEFDTDEIHLSVSSKRGLSYNGNEVVINENSNNVDFRVESNANTHMLFVDGGNNTVGINTTIPSASLDITGDLRVSSHITASGNISSSGANSTFGEVVNLVGEDPRLRLKAVGANHPGIEWHEDSTRKWVLFNDPDSSQGANDNLTFKNASDTELMELDQDGHLYVSSKIFHLDDTDTFIDFTTDDINIQAGGVNMLDFTQNDGSQDEITFNEAGADLDVRIEGDTDTDLLFTNAGTDRVGVGTNSPSSKLQVDGDFTATNITASGNISSSGYLQAKHLILSGGSGVFTSASLAAGGGGGGSFNNFTLTADGGSNQTIEDGNTLDIAGGTNITTAVGATDTVTINLDASPSVTHITASGNISGSSTSTIQVGGNITTAATGSFGEINLDDDKRIKLGTGDDLQIYHKTALSGNHSIIEDSGTGNLIILTSKLQVKNPDNDEVMIQATEDGAVSINHDNSQKLTTSANGITVGGNVLTTAHITASGNIYANGNIVGDDSTNISGINHITASGNISSSGIIYGTDYKIDNNTLAARHGSGAITIANSSDNVQMLGTAIKLSAPVTASGNISASGDLIVDDITADDIAATNVDVFDSDQSNNPRLRVGRADGQHIEINVDDNDNTIKAEQDSDSNGEHNFILTREFDGSGANNFKIQKGTSDELIIDTGGNVSIQTGSLNLVGQAGGHITASGNISGSGLLIASQSGIGLASPETIFHIQQPAGTTPELRVEGLGNTNSKLMLKNSQGNWEIFREFTSKNLVFKNNGGDIPLILNSSHITASGTISASGNIEGDAIRSNGNKVARYRTDESRIRFGNASTAAMITGSLLTLGEHSGFHITASGNLEVAGNISGSSITTASFAKVTIGTATPENAHTALTVNGGSGGNHLAYFERTIGGTGFVSINANSSDPQMRFYANNSARQAAIGVDNTNGNLVFATGSSIAGRDAIIMDTTGNLIITGSGNLVVDNLGGGGHITASGNYSGSAGSTFRIGGKLIAGSKSFLINTPDGNKLEYGVLEGQQNDIFFRGELKGDSVIYLPKEWEWLVDENTITVQLTSIGKHQDLFVKEIKDNKIFIDINGVFKTKQDIHCYHIIHGTRKDVELIRNYQ